MSQITRLLLDYWIVDVGEVRVRCGRYDRAALYFFATRIDPSIPQSGKRGQLAVSNLKGVRLLGLAPSQPLVEKTIGGDQTAPSPERIAE